MVSWGFIPSTKAEDGDPLDVLIVLDAATYPGLVLSCTPVGVLEVVQSEKRKKTRNDRVFAVSDRTPAMSAASRSERWKNSRNSFRRRTRWRPSDWNSAGGKSREGLKTDQEARALDRCAARSCTNAAQPAGDELKECRVARGAKAVQTEQSTRALS